jgi:HEAT repeat protein
MTPPDALLFLSTHCPHCPAVLQSLADLVKQGVVGRLEVVNLEVHGEAAQARGVRSVPWVKVGEFELPGLRSREELEDWARRAGSPEGMADYFHALIKEGQLNRVLEAVRHQPDQLAALLPIVANPEASINVRIGAGVMFEELAGSPALQLLADRLGELTRHADPRVRTDACHYLHLTRSPQARAYLLAALQDDDAVVRETAQESLEALDAGLAA